MLLVLLAAVASSRSVHAFRAWVVALAAVLLIDPFSPLGAGFWFSFLAVAALMSVFVPRTGILPRWKNLLMAQAAVILVLLPVSAAWYGAFSAIGFVANLIAIPWVSLLVVPFVLAGVAAIGISEQLAASFWAIAGHAASLLMICLEWFAGLQGELIPVGNANLLVTCLALAGSFLLLTPRRGPLWIYGFFLLSPLFMPRENPVGTGELEVEILDVGQGTAVVASTPRHSLLYDSGPGDGAEFNRVAGAIAPALKRLQGAGPDRVVISHADLDHAGGLRSILDRYPHALYLVNHPDDSGRGGCRIPMQWSWDGWTWRVLHPSPGLPYYGNDSSCVISIRSGNNGLLLSGDISETVESRLLIEGLSTHPVLLVPHHGSTTSSSRPFIDRTAPSVAIATASLGNRFGFPREVIRERYSSAGVTFWSTGECGALRLRLSPGGQVHASSARRSRERIWRWPAGRHCP
jgi:competence protein ComEC